MKALFFALFISFTPIAVHGSENCPKAKVASIQPQKSTILVLLEGQDWHKVGNTGDPGAEAMYSALLAAQMSGKSVLIRYPDGYDCSAYDTRTDAEMVRIYND